MCIIWVKTLGVPRRLGFFLVPHYKRNFCSDICFFHPCILADLISLDENSRDLDYVAPSLDCAYAFFWQRITHWCTGTWVLVNEKQTRFYVNLWKLFWFSKGRKLNLLVINSNEKRGMVSSEGVDFLTDGWITDHSPSGILNIFLRTQVFRTSRSFARILWRL